MNKMNLKRLINARDLLPPKHIAAIIEKYNYLFHSVQYNNNCHNESYIYAVLEYLHYITYKKCMQEQVLCLPYSISGTQSGFGVDPGPPSTVGWCKINIVIDDSIVHIYKYTKSIKVKYFSRSITYNYSVTIYNHNGNKLVIVRNINGKKYTFEGRTGVNKFVKDIIKYDANRLINNKIKTIDSDNILHVLYLYILNYTNFNVALHKNRIRIYYDSNTNEDLYMWEYDIDIVLCDEHNFWISRSLMFNYKTSASTDNFDKIITLLKRIMQIQNYILR